MAADTHKLGREVNCAIAIEKYDVITPQANAGPLKSRISLSKDGQYIEYTLRVTCEGKQWSVKKRFKEIASLHQVLKARYPNCPDLPAKTVLRNFDPQKIEQRVSLLRDYYAALTKRRDILNCAEVWAFFSFPEHAGAFGQAGGEAAPVQTA